VALHTNGSVDFDVASNPEFLREGSAVADFLNPDRVVLGVESQRAREVLESLYTSFDCPIFVTDLNTVEMIKHASNSFLAMRISFINMIADACEATGADITKVAAGMGLDPRIGPAHLQAGLGYGGSCFPKDVQAFIHMGQEMGVDFSLLKTVEEINRACVDRFLAKVTAALGSVRGRTLGILGLAFKVGTDDTRASQSIEVVRRLLDEGACLRLHDPEAMANARREVPETHDTVKYCDSTYETARLSEALLVLTAWPEYEELDFDRIGQTMSSRVLIDGQNLLDPARMRALGFRYTSVGRP
jgi:UDPglucose 6-dehydrogenase